PKKIAGVGPTPIVLFGDVFVSCEGESLALRDREGKVVRKFEAEGAPKSLACSLDGAQIALGLWGDRVAVFDIATGTTVWENKKQSGWCFSIAWSSDGTKVASGGEGKMIVHDAKTGKAIASKKRGDAYVHAIAFAGDELVTVQDDHLWMWSPSLENRSKTSTDVGAACMVVAGGRAVLLPD